MKVKLYMSVLIRGQKNRISRKCHLVISFFFGTLLPILATISSMSLCDYIPGGSALRCRDTSHVVSSFFFVPVEQKNENSTAMSNFTI